MSGEGAGQEYGECAKMWKQRAAKRNSANDERSALRKLRRVEGREEVSRRQRFMKLDGPVIESSYLSQCPQDDNCGTWLQRVPRTHRWSPGSMQSVSRLPLSYMEVDGNNNSVEEFYSSEESFSCEQIFPVIDWSPKVVFSRGHNSCISFKNSQHGCLLSPEDSMQPFTPETLPPCKNISCHKCNDFSKVTLNTEETALAKELGVVTVGGTTMTTSTITTIQDVTLTAKEPFHRKFPLLTEEYFKELGSFCPFLIGLPKPKEGIECKEKALQYYEGFQRHCDAMEQSGKGAMAISADEVGLGLMMEASVSGALEICYQGKVGNSFCVPNLILDPVHFSAAKHCTSGVDEYKQSEFFQSFTNATELEMNPRSEVADRSLENAYGLEYGQNENFTSVVVVDASMEDEAVQRSESSENGFLGLSEYPNAVLFELSPRSGCFL